MKHNQGDQVTAEVGHLEVTTDEVENSRHHAANQMDSTDYHELLPKPSNDPNDPLNWSWTEKHLVLLVVAAMAFQGPFDAGSPTAGFFQQAETYNVPVGDMLDSIGVYGVFLGIGSFVWLPLSNCYGRSPVYLAAAIVATLGALGCALANSLGAYIGARIVSAFGCSASLSIGSSTIRDLFFVHERGQKLGVWTVCIGTSPYISLIICGFVTKYAGWRWMQWLTFILWAALLIPCLVMLPETRYHRNYAADTVPAKESYFKRLRWQKFNQPLTVATFTRPLVMLKYPSVLFCVIYYGNLYGFCVFGGLSIIPYVFTEEYHFSVTSLGLVGIAFLVGTLLGEPMAGPFSDWVVRYQARRNGGIRYPEQRLHALWLGAVLIPIGLVMFGATLQYKVHWAGPCVAIGLFSFALQIVNTVVTAYPIDCYENMAGEVGTLINMGRQLLSFYVAFYLKHYTDKVGYGWAYGIYGILSVIFALPVLSLIIWGQRLRRRLGLPGVVRPVVSASEPLPSEQGLSMKE